MVFEPVDHHDHDTDTHIAIGRGITHIRLEEVASAAYAGSDSTDQMDLQPWAPYPTTERMSGLVAE